jgi:acyl carrier protein
MGATLDEADLARLARLGVAPLDAERGLGLFDVAWELALPLLVAVRLDSSTLRGLSTGGMLPPIFSGLVRTPLRRAAVHSLADRLAAIPEAEREGVVLDMVRTQAAAVLGHSSPNAVEHEKSFTDLGFDSLAAVELRNRLGAATGLVLPAAIVFDYPSPVKLAKYLFDTATPSEGAAERLKEEAIKGALSRLEEDLRELEPGDLLHKSVHARLRALLANLADSSLLGDDESGEDLGSLSHDEIFELIDEEFGGD